MAETLKFIDLFAGLGGFHRALEGLGHECVFASEIVPDLKDLYSKNFRGSDKYLKGDITKAKGDVPRHDVLAGGFPCPSFSKSGKQNGRREKRGKLMREILDIAKKHEPSYVFLENVGNFERINKGKAWHELRDGLKRIGYTVRATEHHASGGTGLVSPHMMGYPHQRARFYVIATKDPLARDPFQRPKTPPKTSLSSIEEDKPSAEHAKESELTPAQVRCVDHWNKLLKAMPKKRPILSPIWGDEAWEKYPYLGKSPSGSTEAELRSMAGPERFPPSMTVPQYIESLPRYASGPEEKFPGWKEEMIGDSRLFMELARKRLPDAWFDELRKFPLSLRKLEWNCGAEERDLWTKVLQFRPSGLRAKRYNASPALVAMTSTQIPILGPQRRFLTRIEGLRLQGFEDGHKLPKSRDAAFTALGNAVHVKVVQDIARRALAA
jgi:DNA (cytosine-5)-methyltransferase 1